MPNYNYFPQNYAGAQYNPYTSNSVLTPTQPQTQPSSINWVQGEAGARSIPVAPGQRILLMDSESNVFYIKSSDSSGMPLPLRIFKYEEVNPTKENVTQSSNFITKEELDQRLEEFAKSLKEKKDEQFAL